MSRPEPGLELARLLEEEAAQLQQLEQQMHAERSAFVAIRADELDEGVRRLTALAEQASELAGVREDLVTELTRSFGLQPNARLGELLGHLPERDRPRLRAASRAASKAAAALRIEARTGERLLQFSQNSNDALLEALCGVTRDKTAVYDRSARKVSGSATAASLLRGTV